MTFLCVIVGCSWTGESHEHMGNEYLRCQHCSRCGAHRYLGDEHHCGDTLGGSMTTLGDGS